MRDDGGAGRVFLSYRRQDSAWPARQIYELLVTELGAERVFKDVDDIAPGDDFVERIQSAVGSCDVLLALIGPAWSTITDDDGHRRLDDPDDFVRLEVETALRRPDVRVIPILIDNARMPSAAELPAGLAALPRRQAVEVNPVSFDTRRLVATVRQTLSADDPGRPEAGTLPAAAPVPLTPADGGLDAGVDARARPGPSSDPDPDPQPPASTRRLRLPLVVASVAVLVAVLGLVVHLSMRGPAGTTLLAEAPASDPASATPTPTPGGAAVPPPTPDPTPTADPTPDSVTGPDVVAHRGGFEKFPLETREALTDAARAGFAIETDVRWTKDGKAVIVHDEDATLGVVCDTSLRVSETTWKQLRKHCHSEEKAGRSYPIATYDSLMDALSSESPWIYVEVKTDQDRARNVEFVDRIRSHGLGDHAVVTSSDPARLDAVRRLAPELKYLQFVRKEVPVKELTGHHLWGVAVRYDAASKGYVKALKKAGLVVMVWTLNDTRSWQAARATGAQKVLTDKPRAYAEWLAKQ